MACRYCAMERRPGAIRPEFLRHAVDLLLREEGPVELQYFGGEPLLEYGLLMSASEYAAAQARRRGRPLRQVVTTSGLLLSPARSRELTAKGLSFILSLDGGQAVQARQRPLNGPGAYPWELLRRNLQGLIRSGADFFVNMVVTPASAAGLSASTAYLLGEGVRRMQFSCALGEGWSPQPLAVLRRQLSRASRMADAAFPPAEILNRRSSAEPVLLDRQHVVDVDGSLSLGCSIVLEKRWPRLHQAFVCGRVSDVERLPGLRRGPREQLERILSAGLGRRELRKVLGDISLGYWMKRFWEGTAA